jgi:oligopeptide transport system ATP-binding protein
VHAVNGVSLELEAGGALGLVGESGSGKSVTSLAILRLLPRHTARVGGEVWFGGRDLIQLNDKDMRGLRGKEISLVPQDPMSGLNPVLTIGEQVTETIQAHEDVRRGEARRRATELLAAVGIPRPGDQLGRYPHQFSGGMRQRVLIAIALALRPTLLIADEPTTALDVTVQAQVLELLHELTVERGTAILLISHDLGIMARMTRRIAVMYAGHVVESAPTAEVFARPHHPYTVGLLRSIPRVGDVGQPLTPIAGAPPDAARLPPGCPFAPRCAWALDACWEEMPPLEPLGTAGALGGVGAVAGPLSGPGAHLLACYNPVAPGEAEAGEPARPGFRPAPPPPGYGAVIEESA